MMQQINFSKIITFDGTSGSGKGTIAKKVAEYFAIAYLDTGKLYRALSYLLVSNSGNDYLILSFGRRRGATAGAGRRRRGEGAGDARRGEAARRWVRRLLFIN